MAGTSPAMTKGGATSFAFVTEENAMPLKSFQFAGNQRFEQCLVIDSAHVVPGEVGPHVRDIQFAIEIIDNVQIDDSEKLAGRYGPSTAAAVLQYKKKRKIINRNYQSTEDNIVGKMTIASLDEEMFRRQTVPARGSQPICRRRDGPASRQSRSTWKRCGVGHLRNQRREGATIRERMRNSILPPT